MALIEWTDDLSVGVEEFNSHHKRLIEMINKLHDSIVTKTDSSVIEEILSELSNYTMYHFFTEEDAMKKHGYPDFDDHKAIHFNLTDKTLRFMQDLNSGKSGLSEELLAFLKEWLRDHILHIDMNYKSFFNSKGIF